MLKRSGDAERNVCHFEQDRETHIAQALVDLPSNNMYNLWDSKWILLSSSVTPDASSYGVRTGIYL